MWSVPRGWRVQADEAGHSQRLVLLRHALLARAAPRSPCAPRRRRLVQQRQQRLGVAVQERHAAHCRGRGQPQARHPTEVDGVAVADTGCVAQLLRALRAALLCMVGGGGGWQQAGAVSGVGVQAPLCSCRLQHAWRAPRTCTRCPPIRSQITTGGPSRTCCTSSSSTSAWKAGRMASWRPYSSAAAQRPAGSAATRGGTVTSVLTACARGVWACTGACRSRRVCVAGES